MTKARFVFLACLSCFVISLLWAGPSVQSDLNPGFSQRFAFEPGKEIPLDAAIRLVRFEGVKVQAKQKKNGLYIKTLVSAYSESSLDLKTFVRVKFEDKDGNVLGTAVGRKQIEEQDDGTIKAEVLILGSTVEVVAFTLELGVPGT